MNTNQLFLALASSVLFINCTTDDSVLNDKKIVLEANSQHQIILFEGQKCEYNETSTILYPPSPSSFVSDYDYALIYRDNLIKSNIKINGCLSYKIPENPNIAYVGHTYYEVFNSVEKGLDLSMPKGGKDEIEL